MAISRLQKIFGIGPRGALISLVLLAITVWVDRLCGHPAIAIDPALTQVIGVGLVIVGLTLHFWSVWTLRTWWKDDQLCTTGPFKWFRHPMYAAWITFISLGAALYINSWIFLVFVVLLHPIWHRLVSREEHIMAEKFQNEYRAYSTRTGRFIPRVWTK